LGKSVYGDVIKAVPKDILTPKGKSVVQRSYFDANLQHCLITGRTVTGVMHFLNSTLVAKSREIWDQLDNRAKFIILGYENNGSGSSSMTSKPGTKSAPFQRKINLHEISAHDFIQAYSHELEDPSMH
jgi:hypothetical protein